MLRGSISVLTCARFVDLHDVPSGIEKLAAGQFVKRVITDETEYEYSLLVAIQFVMPDCSQSLFKFLCLG